MKTIASNRKTELLLGAGLDVLHQESREWQETIAFWKDETRFFADLLQKKETEASDYGKMLQNLDKVQENLFDYLEYALPLKPIRCTFRPRKHFYHLQKGHQLYRCRRIF